MVRLDRRQLLFGGSAALASLAGCRNSGGEQERFDRSFEPSALSLSGLELSAFPAKVRLESSRPFVRAAAPTLTLEIGSSEATTLELVLENLPAASELSPSAERLRPLGPTSYEATLRLRPGMNRFQVQSSAQGPVRFALISAVQTSTEVFRAFAEDVRLRQPELVLCMGDIADHGSAEEMNTMAEAMRSLGAPFYSTIGNHDLFGDAADRFEELFGPTTVSFDHRGVQVLLLDSASAGLAPSAIAWVEDELARRSGPALVLTHVPPIDDSGLRNHAFRVRDEALQLLDVLGRARADHLFVGHVHDYKTYSLNGVPVHISGGGGKISEWATGIPYHYLEVEVVPGALEPVRVERRALRI